MNTPPRICCSGEVMLEFSGAEQPGHYRQDFAGDSYNTAIYLARNGLRVDYLTRLGDDRFSDRIIQQLREEGIGDAYITRCAGRQPGLYLIDNDENGERSFMYWRNQSPAREMFDQALSLPGLEAFFFTGITLAIARRGIDKLVALLEELRAADCTIVFDPNFRPGLWDSRQQARDHYQRVLGLCDILLPSFEDEQQLWGVATVEECRDMYRQFAPRELVLKGADLVSHAWLDNDYVCRQARAVSAIDTTGAGDSFNAGYLAARLQGADIDTAMHRAQQLAAKVVRCRGAIMPRAQ